MNKVLRLKAKTKNDSAFYVRESIPAPGQYEFPTYLVIPFF